MLKKIIAIRNVGRFLTYDASGDVELKRCNLIFAENGRGKTTLCAILRSLQSGDPAYVRGRTTLGGAAAAEIKIRLTGGTATFGNGAWTDTLSDLAIFDSTFVAENVYSGDSVDLEHKRNLYRVIVGKKGVYLARQIEELDTASRQKSTDIREKRAAVQVFVPQGLTVEAFLPLQEDAAIDAKVTVQARELEAVRQADQIKNHAALLELALPSFPGGFATLLGKTIEGIAEDAERRVAEQINAHAMHERAEVWLSEGLGYIRNDACPFCGQSIKSVTLIGAYKAYFGEAYNALRAEIAALRQQIEAGLGEREIAGIERTLDQNAAAIEFWARYCDIAAPTLAGGGGVADAIRALRHAALSLLDGKAASPLDPVVADRAFTAAHATLRSAQQAANTYNQAVGTANTLIAAKKAATGGADTKTVEDALTHLRATKARHEPDAKKACQDYETAQEEKRVLDSQKAAVRIQLDEYTKQVIGGYEKAINRLLEGFRAGFLIIGTKHGYPGGVASSSYQILINDTPVELGDSNTPLDQPSFRNTLSSGDKSTLGLAFFLAQLEHDPGKAAKIVVFDDPFNSQDAFRKECTVRKIKKCGTECAQVLVLSHDQDFLKRIWDRLEAADRKCLTMSRIGQRNTTICEWDIEEATQALYKAQRKTLTDYYHDGSGDPRDVVQKIRPVLETYCKTLGAEPLADNDTLGVIVGKIRTSGPGHQLFAICDDLEMLNDYTKRYMHGENPHAATEPISDTELQGYVKRTLDVTGAC